LPRYSHAHTLFRYCVFSRSRPPPTSTLFPYTTLFRSSAIARRLAREGCEILTADHAALDLADQRQTEQWLGHEKPDAVFLAAARVGGISANSAYPAAFIGDNLAIALNVIRAAHAVGVRKL